MSLTAQDIVQLVRPYEYFLPGSLIELISFLLVREARDNFPASATHPEYESRTHKDKYSLGLNRILKASPRIYERGDGLSAPLKDVYGLTKADFIFLQDLLIYDQWYEIRGKNLAESMEEAERLYAQLSPESKREVGVDMKRLKNIEKRHQPYASYAVRWKDRTAEQCCNGLHSFWKTILNYNVSFDVPSRNEHAMVVGKTGSGKTSLLQKLIYQDIQTNAAVIVMTVKGDMIPTLSRLACIPDDRLVLIDPQHPTALNLFDLGDEDESAIELISNIFADADTAVTTKQSTPLYHLIKLLLHYRDEQGNRATIRTLRNLLLSPRLPADYQPFLARLTQSSKDFFRDSFHHPEFSPSKQQLFTRMEGLLKNSFTERMFCQPKSGISFQEIMEQGKVLLVLADEGPLGKEGSQFVLRLMLALITIAAKNRKDNHQRPCYVYCDEISAYLTSNVGTILKRCREKNVGLTLAAQDLHDLGELESTIRTNTATKFVGKCEESDANKMAGTMLLDPKTLYTQPKLHFYLKMDDVKHSIPIKVPPGGFKEKPRTIHREHPAPQLTIPTPDPKQSTPDPGTGTSME